MAKVAERYTVYAPTHPGFGASDAADWMEGIDDLARFHLWLIDELDLSRVHLIGHSIGGWTAAEMATMHPGAIDRLVLVAPAGLRPETGEILDIFYHSPAELLGQMVHAPGTVPEWAELFGQPPTPAEVEIATRNHAHAHRVGARGPDRAGGLRRAVPAAPAARDSVRLRGLRPPAAHRAAGRVRQPRPRFPRREGMT
jgi:pimeloyl-ACP methyl ester carboxylesterase